MQNESGSTAASGEDGFGLIPFERQIIALTVAGYSTSETSKKVGISEPAVGRYLARICDKLGVSNEFELVLFALYHRLIDKKELASLGG